MPALPLKTLGLCAAVLALAACGGGAGSEPASTAPAPSSTQVSDRIEPLDEGLAPAAPKAKSATDGDSDSGLARSRLVPPARLQLGPLASAAAQAKRARAAPAPGTPLQIGQARSVAETASRQDLLAQLRWQSADGGVQRAAISLTAQGASGLRLGLLVRSLPAGTQLRFYAQTGGDVVQVSGAAVLRSVQANLDAGDTSDSARTYWGPDSGGPEATLELELPAGANPADLDIALPQLTHRFIQFAQVDAAQGERAAKSAASCNADVSCHDNYSRESRAVARMLFVESGNSYLCTGTLLSDASASKKAWFLSANHCISTQTVASSLETYWFYTSSGCNNRAVTPAMRRLTGGAWLRHADSSTDTSFMELKEAPPPGSYYAGSYVGIVPLNASVLAIHNPKGDLQKISTGRIDYYASCDDMGNDSSICANHSTPTGDYLSVRWNWGTTEGGSDGSGLFYRIGRKRYLVGQLYGTSGSCEDAQRTGVYGRFDLAYSRRLSQWLGPNTAVLATPVEQ